MDNRLIQTLKEEIGFITREQLEEYKKLLEISDVISSHSRQIDSAVGAMTFAYLAIVGDNSHNDLLTESFKHFVRKNKNLIEEMNRQIEGILKRSDEQVKAAR